MGQRTPTRSGTGSTREVIKHRKKMKNTLLLSLAPIATPSFPISLFKEAAVTRNMPMTILLILTVFAFGLLLGKIGDTYLQTSADTQPKGRVFEIRTYTTEEGRLDALHSRFRDHTTRLFKKHGMTNIGYWTPEDSPLSRNTLIYILAHPSKEAATKNWEEFRNDPEWKKVRDESEASGKIVSKVVSVFMDATDYSPLK